MAFVSEISICNQALGWLGANLITSFNDNTVESNLCEANYALIRDTVLEETSWSFALKRKELPALADAELGYSHAFQLPVDCITLIRAYKTTEFRTIDTLDYVLEDRKILTNNGACFIKYVFKQNDVQRYTPNFIQALAFRIASDLAIPLTKSAALQKQYLGLYQMRISDASATDGQQVRNQEINVLWPNVPLA